MVLTAGSGSSVSPPAKRGPKRNGRPMIGSSRLRTSTGSLPGLSCRAQISTRARARLLRSPNSVLVGALRRRLRASLSCAAFSPVKLWRVLASPSWSSRCSLEVGPIFSCPFEGFQYLGTPGWAIAGLRVRVSFKQSCVFGR